MLYHSELTTEIQQLKRNVEKKDQRIKLLEEMLRLQGHKQFGASSEKESAGQGQLFDEAESDSEDETAEEITVPSHTRKKKKRVSIPADLPREEFIYDLSEADKICPHDGAALQCIGEETSEQLDIVPAKIKVLRHCL